MAVIVVENLHKIYKSGQVSVHAIRGIDLQFEQGEFTAIVGPSGSGKTTLLNLLGGIDTPTQGRILIENVDITQLSDTELTDFRLWNIGFVFQAYNLIPVLTAAENIEFIMHLQGRPKAERKKRVAELLEQTGLKDKANARPSQLSGGQQQRVAVARALAAKPKFILADEPTANLDSTNTRVLLDIMEKLNQQEGITFIFSTHDQRVIDKAHRIVRIEDGRIVEDVRIK